MMTFRTVILVATLISAVAWGRTPKKRVAAPNDESKKSLDFDGAYVEGMNKLPLDSVTDLSEGEGPGSRNHLYHRTKKFAEENQELAREQAETY